MQCKQPMSPGGGRHPAQLCGRHVRGARGRLYRGQPMPRRPGMRGRGMHTGGLAVSAGQPMPCVLHLRTRRVRAPSAVFCRHRLPRAQCLCGRPMCAAATVHLRCPVWGHPALSGRPMRGRPRVPCGGLPARGSVQQRRVSRGESLRGGAGLPAGPGVQFRPVCDGGGVQQ